MSVKKPTGDLKKACWKGYTAVGMKMKNGRKVPNCVPVSEEECPVRRQYKELKKLPIKDLRDRIKQSSRVVDVSGFDKESAISHILRRQHGDKRVDQAFGLDEEREIPLSHRTKHDVSHYRVLNNGRDVSKHDSYEEAIAHAGEHRRRLKSKGYDADKISVHAYVKEEKENYGLPAHSMKHVMQKINDGHWEVSSGEVKSGKHLSIIDHTKGKKKRMIHVKEEAEKQTHLVKVTVSEPSLKSAEPMLKGVRVRATSEGEAIKRAKSHFRKAGYKVHDAYHHSTITTVKKAGQIDELKKSTMASYIPKAAASYGRDKQLIGVESGTVAKARPELKRSIKNRLAGIQRASQKLAREEAEQMDEGADVEYHVVIRHPQEGKRSVRISALTPTEAKEKAQRDYPDHKVDKVRDPLEKHYFRGQDLDEGMTKAINKRMKNTLSAMRGRASLGAPEKGLSWQQNKAKAIKAGRAMAKEEVEQVDEGNKENKAKKNAYVANIIKKKLSSEVLPSIKFGRRELKKEEVEQMDELSNETLKSYMQKVAADSQKHPQNPSKRPPEKASRSVAGFDKAHQRLDKKGAEQISEGPQRDATRAKNKLRDAIAGANYKRTGAPVPDAEPQHKTAQAHNKAIGRSLRKMEEGTRDLTAALAKKIEKKTGGKETAVRNKAGLLVTKKKSKDKFEEAFKLSPKNSLKYREHKHEYEREEQIKNRPSYQGYHTQIHVDGRHYKGGDRMGAGERGAQDAAKHAANIAKKTGKKVSIHMIHHETGKTLAIADHTDGKWKYRNLSEAAPIQKQPIAGVEKLVSKINPTKSAKTIKETRNIIREVIKKAVDKQETNKANGKTATGEAMPKVKIDPTIDLGARNV